MAAAGGGGGEVREEKNIFIVNGHGEENITDMNSRPVLPPGYTLITFAECGNVSYLGKTVLKVVEAFLNEANREILENPNVRQLNMLFGEKYGSETIHIYHEGDKYPNLECEFFLDWAHENPRARDKHYVTKSGLYKFPLLGDLADYTERKVIDVVPGSLKYFKKDKLGDIIDLYSGAIYPTKDDLETIFYKDPMDFGKYISEFRKKVRLSITEIFKRGGPGVYYWPVCRNLKTTTLENYVSALNEQTDNLNVNDPKVEVIKSIKNRYIPYLYKWINNYDTLQGFFNENNKNPEINIYTKKSLKKIHENMNKTVKNIRGIRRKSINLHVTPKGGRRRKSKRVKK